MFNEDFFVRKSTLSATTNHQSSHLETILNETNETQKADQVNRVTWGNHLNMFSRPYENLFQRGRTWEAVEQEFLLVALWRLYVSSIWSIQKNYLTSIDCVLCIIALATLRINDSFSKYCRHRSTQDELASIVVLNFTSIFITKISTVGFVLLHKLAEW